MPLLVTTPWTQALLPVRTNLVWHKPLSAVFRSRFFSMFRISIFRLRFPIYPFSRPLLACGSWIPYPLPWSPFLKDLDDSSPCLPICSRCKQRHLTHSSPFHPQFHALKTQNATVSRCGYFQILSKLSKPCILSH